jgi:16S rRNA (uracil1498-N3)-methyltransferase
VYVPDLGAPGAEVALSPDESHYVARVCRARVGDALDGTDGRGTVATLRVTVADREVRVVVERHERRERGRRAWLLCGAPEGRRDDWMVEKLAELGVERWIPLDCARARWDGLGARRPRWERLAIAALKQSRSPFRMEIADPVAAAEAGALTGAAAVRWLGRAGGMPAPGASTAGLLAAAIGPSGGFTRDEEDQLERSGFLPVSLAAGRLRTETAAIAIASVWAAGM